MAGHYKIEGEYEEKKYAHRNTGTSADFSKSQHWETLFLSLIWFLLIEIYNYLE